ncbi:hypothetical protein CEXT_412061 [Caerostris extrusa]|uniref:Uncharacterized protein n=1 Tax=Caerostris extrusa TaxID=172846 RepID=A0AAV4UIB0_CAEEX|nr:hypothetical protein CEXT_412061 [Caerostris extrusa]
MCIRELKILEILSKHSERQRCDELRINTSLFRNRSSPRAWGHNMIPRLSHVKELRMLYKDGKPYAALAVFLLWYGLGCLTVGGGGIMVWQLALVPMHFLDDNAVHI